MKLNLIDQLILLALNDDTGKFDVDSDTLGFATAGAVLLELVLQNRVDVDGKTVRVTDTAFTGEKILDSCFTKIVQSKKERSVSHWIEALAGVGGVIKDETVNRLIESGILRRVKEKVLWVFEVNKFPAQNRMPENMLRKRIHDIVMNDQEPDIREAVLLSLISSCDAVRTVFGKDRAAAYKRRIKEISADEQIAAIAGEAVKRVKEQMEAAMIAIIAASVATTVAVTS